jgi:hypothetical protein
LVGKPEGKRPIGRPSHGLKEAVGWEVVDCIYLAQDKDQLQTSVNVVTNLEIPLKGKEFLD